MEDEVNDFTSSTPNPPQGESKPEDDVFNYNCALLTDGFLFFNFLDAIKKGDGSRIMRQSKYAQYEICTGMLVPVFSCSLYSIPERL